MSQPPLDEKDNSATVGIARCIRDEDGVDTGSNNADMLDPPMISMDSDNDPVRIQTTAAVGEGGTEEAGTVDADAGTVAAAAAEGKRDHFYVTMGHMLRTF